MKYTIIVHCKNGGTTTRTCNRDTVPIVMEMLLDAPPSPIEAFSVIPVVTTPVHVPGYL